MYYKCGCGTYKAGNFPPYRSNMVKSWVCGRCREEARRKAEEPTKLESFKEAFLKRLGQR